MKTYKLTKEEKETIKKMNFLIKKAKELDKTRESSTYYPPQSDKNDIALRRMFEDYSKTRKSEKTQSPIRDYIRTYYELGKILKEDLKLCKRIQGQDILSIISKEPWKFREQDIENRLAMYHEKKLKPAAEKYGSFLEEAIKLYDKYAKQFFDSVAYNSKKFKTQFETVLIKNKVIDGSLVIDWLIKCPNKDLAVLYEHIQPDFEIIIDINGNVHPPVKCKKIPLLKKGIVNCSEKEVTELFKNVNPKFEYDCLTGTLIPRY